MFESAIISAVALVLIIEGLLPFVFPKAWKEAMSEAIKMSDKNLRLMGFASIVFGLLILLFFSE